MWYFLQNVVSDWYFSCLCLYKRYSLESARVLRVLTLGLQLTISSPDYPGVPVCSADSFREAAESGEGSPQRHPVQSPAHDPRQEVPPQDIQVRVCLSTSPTVCLHKSMHAYSIRNIGMCVLQTMLCRHRASGLVGAAECLRSHTVPCCRDVAGTTRRRGAQPW